MDLSSQVDEVLSPQASASSSARGPSPWLTEVNIGAGMEAASGFGIVGFLSLGLASDSTQSQESGGWLVTC